MEEVQFGSTKGGRTQKAQAFEKEFFARENVKTSLASLFLDLFSWGHIPATVVQSICKAASDDLQQAGYGRLTEWQILAQLGAGGLHKNHIHRDLSRKLPKPQVSAPLSSICLVFCVFPVLWKWKLYAIFIRWQCTASEVTPCLVPLKASPSKGSSGRVARMRVPLLLPYQLCKCIWTSGHFKKFILQSSMALEKFWKEVGDHPALLNHPVKQTPQFQRRAVPLCIHVYGAVVTQNIGSASKSCLFISFRSLVATTPKHFVMAAVWTHAAANISCMNTSKCIWNLLSTSFLKMQESGGSETGDILGVPVFLEGDLEYFNEWLQLPRWNSNKPCGLCNIDKPDAKYWKKVSELTPEPWQVPRNTPCPIFRNLMSPLVVCPDLVHSKHLGVDVRFLGSVTWLIIFSFSDPGTSLENRLFQLVHELKDTLRFQIHVYFPHFLHMVSILSMTSLFHISQPIQDFWSSHRSPPGQNTLTLVILVKVLLFHSAIASTCLATKVCSWTSTTSSTKRSFPDSKQKVLKPKLAWRPT